MPTDPEIQAEIAKAVGLFKENVYTADDLSAHLLTYIKDVIMPKAALHKEQVERLIRDVIDLRTHQKKYFAKRSDKVLIECKTKEQALDSKLANLLGAGYSIERFIKNPPAQGDLGL